MVNECHLYLLLCGITFLTGNWRSFHIYDLSYVSSAVTLSLFYCRTYIIVAPNKIRPNQELKVSASILKLEYDSFTVTAIVRKLNGDTYEEICSTKHTFTRVGTYEMSMWVSSYYWNIFTAYRNLIIPNVHMSGIFSKLNAINGYFDALCCSFWW